MLTLYFKPTCPYCQRVLGEAEEMGIKFDLKDISADEAVAAELIEKGGKRQVPFLVDEEHNLNMYESGDIIDHLREHHAGKKEGGEHNGLKIHKSEDSCDVCE